MRIVFCISYLNALGGLYFHFLTWYCQTLHFWVNENLNIVSLFCLYKRCFFLYNPLSHLWSVIGIFFFLFNSITSIVNVEFCFYTHMSIYTQRSTESALSNIMLKVQPPALSKFTPFLIIVHTAISTLKILSRQCIWSILKQLWFFEALFKFSYSHHPRLVIVLQRFLYW